MLRAAVYQPFPMLPGRRGQIWRYAPEYRRPRHFHSEPELNFVVAGTATFGTGRDEISAVAGDLLCWPPGVDHELLTASHDLDLFVVALTPELSERVLASRSALAIAGAVRVNLLRSNWGELEAQLAAPAHTPDAAVGDELVARLWSSAHQARLEAPSGRGLAGRVLRSVLQRPDLKRSQRAQVIGACPSELSRHFHLEVGITLSAYRSRLRLLRFIELVDSGQTLLAAALSAGFGSYSQCHRTFRAAFGCAPRAFFATGRRREMADEYAPFGAEGRSSSTEVDRGIER